MNSGMVGADPDALDRLAGQFHAWARRVDTLERRLSAEIVAAPWHGPHADRFRSDWSRSHRRQLTAVVAFLSEGEVILRRNANEQRSASEGSGGSTWQGGVPFLPGWYLAGLVTVLGSEWRSMLGSPPTTAQLAQVLRRAIQIEHFIEHPELSRSGGKEWGLFGQTDLAHGRASFHGMALDGSVGYSYQDGAEVHYKATLTPQELSLAAGGSIGGMAMAFAAGSISRGPITASGRVQAMVEERAYADGKLTLNRDGLHGVADAGAVVGAAVSARADVSGGGVSEGATVTGYAGAGAMAKAAIEVTPQKIDVTLKLGVALGIGAGVQIHSSIQPEVVAHELGRTTERVSHWLHI